jgi:UDP-N-acetylglucosamine:LPS N-acetylglucosamine transferase
MWLLLMTKYRRDDVLFVSVPPMAYLLNLVLPHRFSMVIWDIYPDTLQVTGMQETHPIYRFWSWLNRRSFRKAYRVFTISNVMADALARYVDRNKLIVQPIWSIFEPDQRVRPSENLFLKQQKTKDRFIVQYSGNIGLTHNVELMLDLAAAMKENENILFQIIGRGPREPFIRQRVKNSRLENVQLIPFQPDEMFLHSLSAADLGVVILDDRVSRGSVPSKAYNLMSLGIPSIYVAGEASQLARDAREFGHARCFRHHDIEGMVQFVEQISCDSGMRESMEKAARLASKLFRPDNADRFAEFYEQPELSGVVSR